MAYSRVNFTFTSTVLSPEVFFISAQMYFLILIPGNDHALIHSQMFAYEILNFLAPLKLSVLSMVNQH